MFDWSINGTTPERDVDAAVLYHMYTRTPIHDAETVHSRTTVKRIDDDEAESLISAFLKSPNQGAFDPQKMEIKSKK